MPLAPAVLASIIGGVGRLAGAGMSALGQRRSDRYNSIPEQVKRLEKAGFSKNAIFSLGGNVPSQNAMATFPSVMQNLGSEYMANQQTEAATDNTKQATKKLEEETTNIGLASQTSQRLLDAGMPELEAGSVQSQTALTDQKVEESKQSVQESQKRVEALAEDIAKTKEEISLIQAKRVREEFGLGMDVRQYEQLDIQNDLLKIERTFAPLLKGQELQKNTAEIDKLIGEVALIKLQNQLGQIDVKQQQRILDNLEQSSHWAELRKELANNPTWLGRNAHTVLTAVEYIGAQMGNILSPVTALIK